MARNLSCFLFKRSKGFESDLLQNAVSLGLVVPVGNVDHQNSREG